MIAVIFEVKIADGQTAEYLDIASELKACLSQIDGFISVERFQSLTDERKILSLSFWQSEAAVEQWRNLEVHRSAQSKGRESVFKNYRLRVAHVTRDYGLNERNDAPADSLQAHR
ncbi:antibiotic biosynthesis monooxygenase family protein [Vibrio hepatarius]|uniref:antibiotic biosynthesis monooxygenase family protein n=1 Tax=Vibrio hepatarius TaxID=171383 RepID=UPI001C086432|nr:antibiotic biosynthesis monooxygenase [Vibrio hepatarius]MBU2897269.1 antibiotic biosynthesis monooxygenase [Vibrio hepatarius]